ncbi:MAG: ABC transporter ATP-binding protein [Phycisphaerales bacterium]|nr:ABC transporter ATP-binding protein [Phycisphaerales bacterium]
MPDMADAVLGVVDVRKSFDSAAGVVEALRGVSLQVRAGEFVAIMGASGSGKSTLLHLMAGLDRPTSGSIFIDGRDLATMSDRERTLFRRRRIGLIFQSYNLLPTLSALENVIIPRILEGADGRDGTQRAESLLCRVDMNNRMTHRPQALSGGEQQRVAIARALMMNPAILLADEPTGNLDTRHGEDIWKLLASLARQEGTTVVTVTHEARGASYADRVIFLKDGLSAGECQPGGESNAALVAARYAELVG